jgi:hypothetical protein
MHHHLRPISLRSQAIILLILVPLLFSSVSATNDRPDHVPEINLRNASFNYQIPTATRTPTPISIGNFVWDDLDGDGRQDPGEPGLAGVKVQLWNVAKNIKYDGDKTDASGIYKVIAPVPGEYRIRVKLPGAGDFFTIKDAAGGDDLLDSDINSGGLHAGFTDIIDIASNVISITSIDTGIIKFRTATPTRTPTPINIGNFVWNDLNGDGEQDAGEPGIPDVKVQVWNTAMTIKYDGDRTDASGFYTVVAPVPGEYRIRVKLPNKDVDVFTSKDALGVDDQKDSDINTTGMYKGYTDILDLPSNLISITTIDAGIIPGVTIKGNDPVTTSTISPAGNSAISIRDVTPTPPVLPLGQNQDNQQQVDRTTTLTPTPTLPVYTPTVSPPL